MKKGHDSYLQMQHWHPKSVAAEEAVIKGFIKK